MLTPDPLITIFTVPKPFINPHISLIQRNAIRSWQHLGDEVKVLIIGDEPGTAEFAAEVEVQHLAQVDRNPLGTPLVSSAFTLVRLMSTSPVLAYVNADILLTPQFVETTRHVYSQLDKFLIVGHRYNLDQQTTIDFNPGWDLYILSAAQINGKFQSQSGSDYFVFPWKCFTKLPKFAIGRGGWDNWMLYHARTQGLPVVDATFSITVVHQKHDYSHLPDGQPHYRLPESSENIRLAGGPRAIFTLADADYFIQNGQIMRIPLRAHKLLREIEIFPLIRLHSQSLANLVFAIFHPVKSWKNWHNRAAHRSKLDQNPCD